MSRADFLPVPQKFNLSAACRFICEAFPGGGVYLVGSCLEKRDYRDVDVRVILDDQEFDRLFPTLVPEGEQRPTPQLDATWSLLCTAISLWLGQHSGLPIDFQIQRQTQANEEFKGRRHALGLYYARRQEVTPASTETKIAKARFHFNTVECLATEAVLPEGQRPPVWPGPTKTFNDLAEIARVAMKEIDA
jgi:hypothetical protein